MWVRGLKLDNTFRLDGICGVAPRVGAWIETYWSVRSISTPMSHPVWVRGLKPAKKAMFEKGTHVAPRVGAWIETEKKRSCKVGVRMSHPVWVRGLKPLILAAVYAFTICRTPCGCVD